MNGTILVVDDDKLITEVLSNLIKTMLKCTVITYNDPLEALKWLKDNNKKTDMIISDFLMPTMNGLEFLKQAKEISKDAVLIFLTGYADKENAIKVINEVGIYQYLEKPWNDEIIIKIIANGLEKKELNDKLERKNVELQAINNELEKLYILNQKASLNETNNFITVISSLIQFIEQKDKEKVGHSRRVAQWSESMGIIMKLSDTLLRNLKIGALLHDIGKAAIPNDITSNKTKLTEEQKQILNNHTVLGEEICKPLNSLKPCLKIIKSHHELLNGKGYPDGISEEEIPLEVRIVTVADIFDSNFAQRPNKDGLDLVEMTRILQEGIDKGELDAAVVAAFWKVCNKESLKKIYIDNEPFNLSL
jgi:putative nucleotidyltransferase with HDIG domain